MYYQPCMQSPHGVKPPYGRWPPCNLKTLGMQAEIEIKNIPYLYVSGNNTMGSNLSTAEDIKEPFWPPHPHE